MTNVTKFKDELESLYNQIAYISGLQTTLGNGRLLSQEEINNALKNPSSGNSGGNKVKDIISGVVGGAGIIGGIISGGASGIANAIKGNSSSSKSSSSNSSNSSGLNAGQKNQYKYLSNMASNPNNSQGQRDWAKSEIDKKSYLTKYADGTTSVPSTGLAMVGERGREMRVLAKGDGIIPHTITENLMNIGRYSLPQFTKMVSGRTNDGNIMNISNLSLSLPNINDNSSVQTIQKALLELPSKLKQKAYSI